jgi:hypothetical protein
LNGSLPSQVPIQSYFKVQTTPQPVNRTSSANSTTWYLIDAHGSSQELQKLRKTDFKGWWQGNDFVSVHQNGAVWNHFIFNDHLWQVADEFGLNRYSKRQVFEMVLKQIFVSPTPLLGKFIRSNYARLSGGLHVGLQMRIGGQWGDGWRYGGDIDNVTSCFIKEVVHVCKESSCSRKCSVFVTTDHPEAGKIVTDSLKMQGIATFDTGFEAVHVEKSSGSASSHLKSYGDWFILTMMDKIVSSRSGFSETASWFGNVPSRGLSAVSSCTFRDEGIDVPDGAEFPPVLARLA